MNIYIKIYFPLQFFISISVLVNIICSTTDENWDYGKLGPDVWNDAYPSCAGRSQSPINIRTACTTYQTFTPFYFSSAYTQTHNFMLINNGNTIIGTYNGNDLSPLKLTGGGLHGTFEFVNFHLHWGQNYKSGSEHQM
jgi:carbonic anhydrase